MTTTVTTSIVIDFTTQDADATLQAEIDDRETGYNLGETTFYPGDSPAFLLYMTSTVLLDLIASSEGAVQLLATGIVIPQTEWLTYANEKSANTKYPIVGGISVSDSAGIVGSPLTTETSVYFAVPQIGVLEVNYNTVASAYRVVGAAGTRPVVVFISGHTP